VTRVIEIAGLRRVFRIAPTMPEAVQELVQVRDA
jgi:hypothetical protein